MIDVSVSIYDRHVVERRTSTSRLPDHPFESGEARQSKKYTMRNQNEPNAYARYPQQTTAACPVVSTRSGRVPNAVINLEKMVCFLGNTL